MCGTRNTNTRLVGILACNLHLRRHQAATGVGLNGIAEGGTAMAGMGAAGVDIMGADTIGIGDARARAAESSRHVSTVRYGSNP